MGFCFVWPSWLRVGESQKWIKRPGNPREIQSLEYFFESAIKCRIERNKAEEQGRGHQRRTEASAGWRTGRTAEKHTDRFMTRSRWLPLNLVYWKRSIFTGFHEIVNNDRPTDRWTNCLIGMRGCIERHALTFLSPSLGFVCRITLFSPIYGSVTDRRTDRRTDPFIELRGRFQKDFRNDEPSERSIRRYNSF